MLVTRRSLQADISKFTDFTSVEDGLAYETNVESVIHQIETCRVPVIAALNGAVTGGDGHCHRSPCACRRSAIAGMPIADPWQLFGSVEFTSAGGFVW